MKTLKIFLSTLCLLSVAPLLYGQVYHSTVPKSATWYLDRGHGNLIKSDDFGYSWVELDAEASDIARRYLTNNAPKIQEKQPKNTSVVYPNFARHNAQITLKSSVPFTDNRVKLTAIDGREFLIVATPVGAQEMTLAIPQTLPSGLFVVQCETDSGVFISKLLIL